MSKSFNQFLMLGGFYFILSFVLNTWHNDFSRFMSLLLLGVLLLSVVVLCFKKNFVFLEKFELNNLKISNYLKAVGVAQYFNIFFDMLPKAFIETNMYVPTYFKYTSKFYYVILFVALIYATYYNLTKYKNK